MIAQNILEQVADELGLPVEVVREAYKSYYQFIRHIIVDLPLKETLSEEEFNKLRTSFNIPSIGKLSVTYERYLGVKKRFQYIKSLKEQAHEIKED